MLAAAGAWARPSGTIVLELQGAPAQAALARIAELGGLDIVASGELAAARVDVVTSAETWDGALQAVAAAAGAQLRVLPSGLRVVATACRFALPAPTPLALPTERHRWLGFDDDAVALSPALGLLADKMGLPRDPALRLRQRIGLRAVHVEAGDLLEAIRLAEALEPAPAAHAALELAPRPDARCGAVDPAPPASPPAAAHDAPAVERYRPEQMTMRGYVQRGDAMPVALLETPAAELVPVAKGNSVGPAMLPLAGIFGDGVHLAGEAGGRPPIAFAARHPDALPAPEAIRAAASRGDALAMRRLGMMSADGNGVARDARAAAGWLRSAAALGDAPAQLALAFAYADGSGIEKDPARSREWLERAARQGFVPAQASLGARLLRTDGSRAAAPVEAEGLRLLNAAATHGDVDAQEALALYYDNHDALDPGLVLARRWYEAAADQGDLAAVFALRQLLVDGPAGARDVDGAIRWLRRAAALGMRSEGRLGALYFDRHRDADDDREAAWWLRQAAADGDPDAEYRLGRLALDGRGMARDPAVAAAWLAKSANQGVPAARGWLGALYRQGTGVPRDPRRAAAWLRKAATAAPGQQGEAQTANYPVTIDPRGDRGAQLELARLLLSGELPDADPIEAQQWLLVAGTLGNEDARALAASNAPALTEAQRAEAARRAEAWLASRPLQ